MARRVVHTEYVEDAPEVRRTEVVDDAPVVRRRRTYIDDGPMVRRGPSIPMGMPMGAMIGLAVVAFLLLLLFLGRV